EVSGHSLRKSEELPLHGFSGDNKHLCYHEGQTSSLSWGPDETYWSELFLVDTYFGSEEDHETYPIPPQGGCTGDGWDPPLGGRGTMKIPIFDPREYFLMKIDQRVEQVTMEYSALVETFDKRMEKYIGKIRYIFEDDGDRTNTQTLSNVIETIHIFVDCLGGIIDSWGMFSRNEILFFTRHAPEKLDWPPILSKITRNMSELDRLRNLLLTKKERLKFKLESYVAFPPLFTTAFFSMDFAHPPYPWAVFSGVLVAVSLLNYMIASQSNPYMVWKDLALLSGKAWQMLKSAWIWCKGMLSLLKW
ncbi:hypothetical protein GQ44DRAFT_605115, partial [Phaeosphaeriaceae sp. PMI808]